MAYSILTNVYRFLAIIQGVSALPEDQFVSNWYFKRSDTPAGNEDDFLDTVIAWLREVYFLGTFYTGLGIPDYLSSESATFRVKAYDLGDAGKRFPVRESTPDDLSTVRSGTAAPTEVALCLSFKGGNLATQRGRVYIGPFGTNALGTDGRPVSGLRVAMQQAGTFLLDSSNLYGDATWSVVSPTTTSFVGVTEGWVDDAWDTQRSRGVAPSLRTKWDDTGVIV